MAKRTMNAAVVAVLALCLSVGVYVAVVVKPQSSSSSSEEERGIPRSVETAVNKVVYTRFLHSVAPHVDWDRLRDEYEQAYEPQQRQLQRSRAQPFWTDAANKGTTSDSHVGPRAHHAMIHQVMGVVQEGVASATGGGAPPEEDPIQEALDEELDDVNDMVEEVEEVEEADAKTDQQERQGDSASFNGKPIAAYSYSPGTNCGDADQVPPCAPNNIRELCSKGGTGKLSTCLEACIPSFCCVHDAPPATNFIAASCNTEPNCAQFAPCYIAWWKLHDTIGPATLLQLEQNDDFYDIEASDISGDVTGVQFLQEMLFHHFDDSREIIDAGTVNGEFDSDRIFLNPDFWDAESVIGKVNQP